MRRVLLAAGIFLAAAANARAQDGPEIVGAIVAYLKETHPHHASMEELWIRDGVFDVSRHDVDYSFREPLREWSQAEKDHLESTARSTGLPFRFCQEDCDEHPYSALIVAFGEVKRVSAEQAVIRIQLDSSDEKSTWRTSYEMVLDRSPEGGWSVTESRPGAHSDAVSCFELYGHSCDEEIEKKRKQADDDRFQPGESTSAGSPAVEDDGYTSEFVGALIGGVVSFYGLGILSGGGSYLFIIPGALIGMGIGSRF